MLKKLKPIKAPEVKSTFRPIKTMAGLKAFFRTYVARKRELAELQRRKKLEKKAIDKKYEQAIKSLKRTINNMYKHMYEPGMKLLEEKDRGVIVYDGFTFGRGISDRLVVTNDIDFDRLTNLLEQKKHLIESVLLDTKVDSVDEHEIIKVKKTLNKNMIKHLIDLGVFTEEELLAYNLKRVKVDTLYVTDKPHQHVNEVEDLHGTDKIE